MLFLDLLTELLDYWFIAIIHMTLPQFGCQVFKNFAIKFDKSLYIGMYYCNQLYQYIYYVDGRMLRARIMTYYICIKLERRFTLFCS